MKKLLFLLLFIPSIAFAGIFERYVSTYNEKYYSIIELKTFIQNGGDCKNVKSIESYKKYSFEVLEQMKIDELNLDTSSLLDEQKAKFTTYKKLYTKKELTQDEQMLFKQLQDTKDSFSPLNSVYKGAMSAVENRIISGCNGVKINIDKVGEKKDIKVKPVTDGDIESLLKTIKEKLKLMSKTQKENFLKKLKELK